MSLLGPKDKDIIAFIKSKVFNTLTTFTLNENVDSCYDTAHAALSANTLLYLIGLPPTEWRSKMLDEIYYTFSVKYPDEEEFVNMKTTMLGSNPSLAVVNEHSSIPHRCEDPTKALINLFELFRGKHDEIKANLETIVERLIIEAIGRNLPKDFTL